MKKIDVGCCVTPNGKYVDVRERPGEAMRVTATAVIGGKPCIWVDHPDFHGAYAADGFDVISAG